MAKGNGGGSDVGITVGRISIKVSPDTKQFRKDLKADLEEIERTLKGDVEVTAHLDSAQARADFQRMKNQLQKDGRVKLTVDTVQGKDGVSGKGGKGGGGNTAIAAFGKGGGFGIPKGLIPSFGSGINPAGYVAILAAVALVAAPLVGLVSALVLAIPGMISAIATPMMAIGLGLDGIKRAGANSGLFKYDDEGKLEGLGAVFDNVKTKVSAAFDEGLTPALKTLASSIDPLLGSLPKVATGLTDMFQGFVDSLTSSEGMRLFDDTIKNIGAAMSQAAPGVRSFTDGFLGLANSFTKNLPGLSTWFNKTGDDFSKWIKEMTAPLEGPGLDGKSKMDLAFEGLGGTLETIGAWIVDMGKAGLNFVTDPKKMQDFIATLDNIGKIITGLVDLGNKLGPVWDLLAKINGIQNPSAVDDPKNPSSGKDPKKVPVPEAPKPAISVAEDIKRTNEVAAQEAGKGFWGTLKDFFDGPGTPSPGKGGVQIMIGNETVSSNASWDEIASTVKSESARINSEITVLESAIAARTTGGFKQSSSDAVNQYKEDLEGLKADLAKVQAAAEMIPMGNRVDLASSESPLPGTSFVEQMITDLKAIPAAAVPAKDALQQVKDTGVMTPEALGALSEQAQQPAVAAPAAPAEIPAPDTSAFDTAMQQLPQATNTAMQGVVESVRAGGATAAAETVIIGNNMVTAMTATAPLFQTVGLQMMAGLATGIDAGSSMAITAAVNAATNAYTAAKNALEIESPSKKFAELGKYTMEGLAVGMDKGFGPVLDQAKDIAGKVSAAFADGSDPTLAVSGFSDSDIKKMTKALNMQMKFLDGQAKALDYQSKLQGGNDALKARAAEIREQRSQLGLQKDMLDLTKDYNEESSSGGGEDPFVKGLSGLMSAPADFAKATGKQFMSDLGIGGDGLIGNAITEGISYIFNIASVDDALSVKDREDNKAMQSGLGR